jgi:hypothetical protein
MNISEIIKWFGSGYFGSALGVIGILAGLATFYASRKRKILAYSYKQKAIIKDFKNEINGLEIKYNENLIEDLTSTNIGIWNKGRDPIKRGDIAPKAPIEIQFKENIIGDPTVLFIKTMENQINLSKKGKKIVVDFDFLDFEDGITIQVFHTSSLILESKQNIEPRLKLRDDNDLGAWGTNIKHVQAERSKKFRETLAGTYPERTSKSREENEEDSKAPFTIKGKIIGSQEGIKLVNSQDDSMREFFLVFLAPLAFAPIAFLAPFIASSYSFSLMVSFVCFSILPYIFYRINHDQKKAKKNHSARVVDKI